MEIPAQGVKDREMLRNTKPKTGDASLLGKANATLGCYGPCTLSHTDIVVCMTITACMGIVLASALHKRGPFDGGGTFASK